jgi:hypothetical protein
LHGVPCIPSQMPGLLPDLFLLFPDLKAKLQIIIYKLNIFVNHISLN